MNEVGDDYARLKFTSTENPATRWTIAGQADTLMENSRMNFYYNGPEGVGDRVTIRGNGNVGIQTFSPEATLDVKGGRWNLEGGDEGDLEIGTSVHNLRVGTATGGGGAGITRVYSSGPLLLGSANASAIAIATSGNVGIGTTSPGNKLRVHGDPASTSHVLSASSNYSGSVDVRAVEGFSTPADGYGYGGYFIGGYHGIYSAAQGGGYTGTVYGIRGVASGSTGTRIGIHGSASGGTTNWAGVFTSGNVYVQNELRIGSGAFSGASGYKVAIDGKMIAEEVRVQLSGDWPDYVFDPNYYLPDLEEVEQAIKEQHHLPNLPSAAEVAEEGIAVGEMHSLLLRKIEELTLYTIEQEKRIKQLESLLNHENKIKDETLDYPYFGVCRAIHDEHLCRFQSNTS